MQTLAPTWNLGHTTAAKWYVRLFPSLQDIAFLLPIFVLFARMKGTQLLFSDGDTGWHILTGEWILSHRAVPHVDLFSFSKPNAPWFAWEWGWDVAAAAVHHYAGLAGIGFVITAMLGLFSLLVYRLALSASHNNLLSILITALTAAVSSIHWLARPHLVSWIFALLFLNILESVRLNASAFSFALYIVLPVLTVFWTNLHGGFVAGLMIIGCYALGEAMTGIFRAETSAIGGSLRSGWTLSFRYWQSFALCAAATFINPYGWQLHKHIYSYLSDSDLLDKIQEFQSISFHAGPALYFEIMLVLAVFAVLQNVKELQFTPVLLICLWSHLALVSARHIPLFAIVAAPFVAATLSAGIGRIRQVPILSEASVLLTDISGDLRAMELTPRLHLTSAAALLLIAGLFALGQPPFTPQFNRDNFPVQAIPVLKSHPGRVFTTDQWGDYLLYRLYPAQRVFFDGRSDFYGNDFVKVNQRLIAAEHDWKSLLRRFEIGLVVLKPEMPLSAVLKLTSGAKVLFDDGSVIVFDTAGIGAVSAKQVSSNSDSVNRTPGFAPVTQPDRRLAVLTNHQSRTSKKGKTS
jgi:hypothetical protein